MEQRVSINALLLLFCFSASAKGADACSCFLANDGWFASKSTAVACLKIPEGLFRSLPTTQSKHKFAFC